MVDYAPMNSPGQKFSSLVDLYTRSVTTYAARPLFGVKKNDLWVWQSYADFAVGCDATRAGLAALGLQKGDRLALITNNRPEWAMAAYATYARGGAIVPMYEQQHEKEWKFILADSGAKIAVCATAAIAERLQSFRAELPALEHVVSLQDQGGTITWSELLIKSKDVPAPVALTFEDLADVIYTSGTTGQPKGVMLTHGNIISNINAVHEVAPMNSTDCSLSFLPWAHVMGQTCELHCMFSLGGAMALVDQIDKITQYLTEVKPTVLISVPRIFNRIYTGLLQRMEKETPLKRGMFFAAMKNEAQRAELAKRDQKSTVVELKHKVFDKLVFSKVRDRFGGRLRYAISGGAAISREVAEFIDRLGIMVIEGYGLTETSPIVACNTPEARKIGTVGKPLRGVRVSIDKEASGDPVHGEIVVYGPNVMKGYYNRPEDTAAVFTADGGFRTGDLGFLDEAGFLSITGRIKEQYKLENGKYVAPAPLEDQLKLSPFIANALVFGDNKPHNVALIVVNAEAIKAWANDNGKSLASDLLTDPAVRDLYKSEVTRLSQEWKSFESLKNFALIDEDFTTQNGMLTPKMSLKRRVILDRHKTTLDKLY
jgi:long-chain acyl-CoA synthetase